MNARITKNMAAVRAAWDAEERRLRRELATAMQLQLRALVASVESRERVVEQRQKSQPSLAKAL